MSDEVRNHPQNNASNREVSGAGQVDYSTAGVGATGHTANGRSFRLNKINGEWLEWSDQFASLRTRRDGRVFANTHHYLDIVRVTRVVDGVTVQISPPPVSSSPAAAEGWDGAARIAAERKRQVSREGWTAEHDDSHDRSQMAIAAIRYVEHAIGREPSVGWPWDLSWWKPSDPVRELTKAGALIAAEIDRRLRFQKELPTDLVSRPEREKPEAVCDYCHGEGCPQDKDGYYTSCPKCGFSNPDPPLNWPDRMFSRSSPPTRSSHHYRYQPTDVLWDRVPRVGDVVKAGGMPLTVLDVYETLRGYGKGYRIRPQGYDKWVNAWEWDLITPAEEQQPLVSRPEQEKPEVAGTQYLDVPPGIQAKVSELFRTNGMPAPEPASGAVFDGATAKSLSKWQTRGEGVCTFAAFNPEAEESSQVLVWDRYGNPIELYRGGNFLADEESGNDITGPYTQPPEPPKPAPAEGEVVRFLKRLAGPDECGCTPICTCDCEGALRLWKENVKDEAGELLQSLRKVEAHNDAGRDVRAGRADAGGHGADVREGDEAHVHCEASGQPGDGHPHHEGQGGGASTASRTVEVAEESVAAPSPAPSTSGGVEAELDRVKGGLKDFIERARKGVFPLSLGDIHELEWVLDPAWKVPPPEPVLTVDEVLSQAAYGLKAAKFAMTNQRYDKPRIGMEDDFANVEKAINLIDRYVAQVNAGA